MATRRAPLPDGRGSVGIVAIRNAMEELRELPLEAIRPGPYQPRVRFDEARLDDLAHSIRTHGLIQPIVVRAVQDGYEIVAGERRFRAAQRLGLGSIPAVVRALTDEEALEAALVENLQREDITVVEVARAYRRLIAEFGYTHAAVAERTGKSRTAVTNTLRLLSLSDEVLALVDAGELSEGHARAILGVPYPTVQLELAQWVVRNAIPVRETERKVRALLAAQSRLQRKGSQGPAEEREAEVSGETWGAYLEALEDRIRERLGTRVTISYRAGRGSMSLEFYSDEDLCRILELLGC